MKAPKTASQIKRFLRLFGHHACRKCQNYLFQTGSNNKISGTSITAVKTPANSAVITQQTNELFNVFAATNLEQWKVIRGLHKSPGLTECWDMEQTNRTAGIPVLLSANGEAVLYKIEFIDIRLTDDKQIQDIEMHSPIMNIDETRELGLQICKMMRRDPGDFLAWCDRVGNKWLDAPLFSSHGMKMPNSDKHFGFGVLRSYNNERPWYILFSISSP